MAGTDSSFSAAGQGLSVGNTGYTPNRDHANRGNPAGDQVNKDEGNNPVNGSSGETKIEGKDVSKATVTTRPQWKTGTDPLWPNS